MRAGRALFAARPADAVTIDDIVREADVAKGSFYNHFPDRDALVLAVVHEVRQSLEGAVQAANDGVEDPARRIARAVCVYQRFALEDPERARVLLRIQAGAAELEGPRNRGLVEDLTAGIAAGRLQVATLEAAMLFVIGASQSALMRNTRNPSPELAVSLTQQMCALILKGLGVPSAEAETIAAQSADEIVRRGGSAAG